MGRNLDELMALIASDERSIFEVFPLLPDSHPLLAQRMPLFDRFGPVAEQLSELLVGAMFHHGGIGLAANQMGLGLRMFVAVVNGAPTAFFNPVITDLDEDTEKQIEGCLSFPGLRLSVARPKSCTVVFQDSGGVEQTLNLSGIDARCVMHETDHLNGVVMTAKVSRLQLDMARKRLRKQSR